MRTCPSCQGQYRSGGTAAHLAQGRRLRAVVVCPSCARRAALVLSAVVAPRPDAGRRKGQWLCACGCKRGAKYAEPSCALQGEIGSSYTEVPE